MSTGSETLKTTNLTSLPLGKAIFKMALPATGWMLIEALYYLVDTFWVGKLGTNPLAAISATSFFLWTFLSLAEGLDISANALVSQSVGADKPEETKKHLKNCLQASIMTSVPVLILFFVAKNTMFGLLGLEKEVIDLSIEYVSPWILAMPVFFMISVFFGVFRGTGDAKTPMILMGLLVILNAFLDPLFIFGYWIFPEMGLAGAAWATVLCHVIVLVVAVGILKKRGIWIDTQFRQLIQIDWQALLQIAKIGLPMAINMAIFSLIYVGLTAIIAKFGSDPIAAIGLGHRIESFPYFITMGFSLAASTLVGQYLGANKPEEASKAAWRSSFIAAGIMTLYAIGIYFAARPICMFFITDPSVIAEATVYIRIVGICWVLGCFEIVLEGAFSGAGKTLPALIIGVPFTALRIPAAYIFAVVLGFGTISIWWMIGLTSVIKGILLIFWFSRGTWKTSRLAEKEKSSV